MDAQIKPNEEECALGMEHEDCDAFTIHGSAYDETTATLPSQRTASASANQEQSRYPPSVILYHVTDSVAVL